MAIAIDMMNQYGVDNLLRKIDIYDYGFDRNYILHHCNLHRSSKNKKDKICISRGTMW